MGIIAACTVAMVWTVAQTANDPPAPADVVAASYQQTYTMLDRACAAKRRQLTDYLDRVKQLSGAAPRDAVLLRCFKLLGSYDRLARSQPPSPQARQAIEQLKQNTLAYCIDRYFPFYDLLFVRPDGLVFHTVRHNDYDQANLFTGIFKDTSLAQRLSSRPDEAFIDFQQGAGSQQPSAFFVEPVVIDGRFSGWFVLQCDIGRINDLFVRDEHLGQTGELFLVNQQCQMLTDSRFRADSSILSLHLSPANIHAKFRQGRGHKVVTDYRGYRALSSFDVCSMMGNRWLLVAKMDEAEMLTRCYREHRGRLAEPLLRRLARQRPVLTEAPVVADEAPVVDIDTFGRATCDQWIQTVGVSACTAVVIHVPGQVAYLGHASSYDCIYGRGEVDLVNHMIQRLRTYEIRPYRLREVQVDIIAPHTRSIRRAIDKLVDQGVFLSQIRFLHHPTAASGSIWHQVNSGQTIVRWRFDDPQSQPVYQTADQTPSIGDLVSAWLPDGCGCGCESSEHGPPATTAYQFRSASQPDGRISH